MTAKVPNIEAARPTEPMPYSYTFRGNFMGDRKGQSCRILFSRGKQSVQIEFEDGYTTLVTRYVLRRKASDHVERDGATG